MESQLYFSEHAKNWLCQCLLRFAFLSLRGRESQRSSETSRCWTYFVKTHNLRSKKIYAYYFLLLNNSERPAKYLVSEAEKSVQRFYQSCLQVEATNQYNDTNSRNALLQLLDQIGGWPLMNEILNRRLSKQNEWDFQGALETSNNVFRVDAFFRWRVDWIDPRPTENTNIDFRRHVIKVRQDKLGKFILSAHIKASFKLLRYRSIIMLSLSRE